MSENRCPNCRAKRADDERPCRECGWMPLRATEMLILDGQSVKCPQCSQARPATGAACPHCGTNEALQALSPHYANFHTSSLLLVATIIAFCFLLLRLSMWLGALAFTLTALSMLRTSLLAFERKRHRYPTPSTGELTWNFVCTLFGIIVALLLFVFASMLMVAIPAAIPIADIIVIVLISLIMGTTTALFAFVRYPQARKWIAIGLASTLGLSLLVFVSSGIQPSLIRLLFPVSVLPNLVVALVLACRRGGVRKSRSFLIGAMSGLSYLGLVEVIGLDDQFVDQAIQCSIFSTLLWPLLLSIVWLEKIWSWEDAFPRTKSQREFETLAPIGRTYEPIYLDDEGIEFSTDQPTAAEQPVVNHATVHPDP